MDNRTTNIINYVGISLVVLIILSFLLWAKQTDLDLITRGMGRVITEGQNKSIQTSENGIIASFEVEEGDAVQIGQVLATINPTAAQGSLNELNARKNSLNAQLTRLNSEIYETSNSKLEDKLIGLPKDIVDSQITLFIARRENLKNKYAEVDQEIAIFEKNLDEVNEQVLKNEELNKILSAEEREILPLIKSGLLGSSEEFRLKREKTNLDSDWKILNTKIQQLRLSIVKTNKEKELIKSEYLRDVYDEKAKVTAALNELESKIPILNQKLEATQILAPVSGNINRVFYNIPGAVVSAGEVLAEIVPNNKKLMIQAYIDPKDIGQIEPGQSARISLTAFDSTRFGFATGILKKVSPDAVFREDSNSYMFAVTLEFENNLKNSNGEMVEIVPGMVAQVDITRGKRSVLEYFWQPIAKLKDDAFRQ